MSRFFMGLIAVAALVFTLATPTTADARKGFRYTCVGAVHTFHGCFRRIGRDVRGNPIRLRPRPAVYFLFWRVG